MKLLHIFDPREFLFPSKCAACRELLSVIEDKDRTAGDDALCPKCREKFEEEKRKLCPRCKKPMYKCECIPELLAKAHCNTLMRVCGYNGYFLNPVTRILFTLKQRSVGSCERFAAYQLAERLKVFLAEYGDCDFCVTYIPRRKHAVVLFGHDHGEILAKRTADLCGLEFHKLLKNTGRSKEQKNLTGAARVKNASIALIPSRRIKQAYDKNIILIDDIVTSGASLSSGTSILLDAGAASVTCLCFASTEKNKNDRYKY